MKSLSKTQIDKAGRVLVEGESKYNDDPVKYIELEECFDQYRQEHLQPLSEITIEIQKLLLDSGTEYYIAQRLKRKPQIIRKLKRLSVRLTQLQDIGGCRIIVPKNKDVDILLNFFQNSQNRLGFLVKKYTDYREKGRDDTGYRALHLIIEKNSRTIELQIRSRIQHYWAESIERTSVFYGYHLKEKEGDQLIIKYFKHLSDIFYEIESNREPSTRQKNDLDDLREQCTLIIQQSDKHKVFDSYVNEGVIKTLIEKEKQNGSGVNNLNNWLLVFNWNEASFVTWEIVSRDPKEAVQLYVEYERAYPSNEGFEVVLIGSSDIQSVQKTHSHYFGLENYENILETLDQSLQVFSRKIDIDIGARKILAAMIRHKCWGSKTVKEETLKNHFCKGILGFEDSLRVLFDKEYVRYGKDKDFSLNLEKKSEIDSYQ